MKSIENICKNEYVREKFTSMIEFTRNNLEKIMESLLDRTEKSKQKWELLDYNISLQEEKQSKINICNVSHGLKVQTKFSGQILVLEIIEKIYLPSEKGDIVGHLSYNGKYGIQNFKFGLSYEWEKYNNCNPGQIGYEFRDSVIIKLAEIILDRMITSKSIQYDMTNTIQNEIMIKHPIITLCDNLANKKMILEFHRCILDVNYRKKMLNEYMLEK